MTNEWSHLPVAAQIDRILESYSDDPQKWIFAAHHVGIADRIAARHGALENDICQRTRRAARAATDKVAPAGSPGWVPVRDAVLALIAWHRSAAILDMDPAAVKVIAALGDEAAILLLPAVIVMSQIKSKT